MHINDRDLGAKNAGIETNEDNKQSDEDEQDIVHEGYDNPDPDSVYRKDDADIGEATDACIRSLHSDYRWAIDYRCGMARFKPAPGFPHGKPGNWIFAELNYFDVLHDAEAALILLLRAKKGTRALFT